MFESYMRYQYADPRGRRQMTLSALVAGALTLSTITLAWAASKMEITRVDAPTMDTILFQLGADAPMPPPPPPPPIGGDEIEDTPDKPDTPPDEVLPRLEEVIPKASPRAQGSRDGAVKGGVPNGVRGGVPNGISIGVPTNTRLTDIPTYRPPPTTSTPTPPEPIAAVMARGVYTPNPDPRLFMGKRDRRPCTNRTHFCVDAGGRTAEVRTAKSCGDADVDRICRDAVKKWRFKAATVGGEARRSCSVVEFSLTFRE